MHVPLHGWPEQFTATNPESQAQLLPAQVLFAGQYALFPQETTLNAAFVPQAPEAGALWHVPSVVHMLFGQHTTVLPPVPYGQQPDPQSSGATLGQPLLLVDEGFPVVADVAGTHV